MAKYTIELRKVCDIYGRNEVENWFKEWNLSDYLTNEEINVITERGVFNKDRLATQIIDTYFMREIGEETPALFKLRAKNKMKLLMEEYSPLIYSASIKYDPLVNVDVTETYSREVNDKGSSLTNDTGHSESNNTNNASGLTVNSDTPQGQISKSAILSGSYASNTQAGESTSSVNDTTNTSASSKEDRNSQSLETSSKTTKGNSGVSATAQKMIEQYRDNIRAINREIIEELNILFMGLF